MYELNLKSSRKSVQRLQHNFPKFHISFQENLNNWRWRFKIVFPNFEKWFQDLLETKFEVSSEDPMVSRTRSKSMTPRSTPFSLLNATASTGRSRSRRMHIHYQNRFPRSWAALGGTRAISDGAFRSPSGWKWPRIAIQLLATFSGQRVSLSASWEGVHVVRASASPSRDPRWPSSSTPIISSPSPVTRILALVSLGAHAPTYWNESASVSTNISIAEKKASALVSKEGRSGAHLWNPREI